MALQARNCPAVAETAVPKALRTHLAQANVTMLPRTGQTSAVSHRVNRGRAAPKGHLECPVNRKGAAKPPGRTAHQGSQVPLMTGRASAVGCSGSRIPSDSRQQTALRRHLQMNREQAAAG